MPRSRFALFACLFVVLGQTGCCHWWHHNHCCYPPEAPAVPVGPAGAPVTPTPERTP